ncbi:MAG: VWA domain-containing protein, partial [Candidatus Omnitrophica bacterium]|nr:VWA domain-containing protein [Candidatus Omnitrophota bacterium]
NLKDCGGTRAMVLISDGRDEDGTGRQLSRTSLETAISAAKKAKMPVFAIGIGQDVGRPILERIADETGGGYLHSPEGQDLDRLYTEIARRLGRGDEGYFKLVYRSTHPEKDGSTRTIVLWNDKTRAVANYPAPRGLLWPLTKGF